MIKKVLIICSILICFIFGMFNYYVLSERTIAWNNNRISFNYFYNNTLTTSILIENSELRKLDNIPLYSFVNPVVCTVVYKDKEQETVEILAFRYNDFERYGKVWKSSRKTSIKLVEFLRFDNVEVIPGGTDD